MVRCGSHGPGGSRAARHAQAPVTDRQHEQQRRTDDEDVREVVVVVADGDEIDSLVPRSAPLNAGAAAEAALAWRRTRSRFIRGGHVMAQVLLDVWMALDGFLAAP